MEPPRATLISPLRRYPAFRRLWLGLATSRLGDELTVIAITWLTLELTGSGAAAGLVLLCTQIPSLVTSPYLGRLLDRYQPRAVMVVDNLSRGCLIAAVPVLHWLGVLQVWHLVVMALLVGVLWPATEVGVEVVVPHLVPDRELEGANTLLSMVWEIATLIGPAAGGFLIKLVGGPAVLWLDALSFLIMGVVLLSLPDLPRGQPAAGGLERGRLPGFGTLVRMRLVLLVVMLILFMLFVQGLQSVALAVYSQRTLVAGASGYGLLLSAFGLGSLVGLLVNHRFIAGLKRPALALAAILALFGLLVLPLTFLRSLPAALLCLALGGFVAAPYFVVGRSLMQRLVPAHLRGEVLGAQGALGTAGYPLGGAVGGLLADYLGAPLAIGLSALGCVAVGLVGLLSPVLRQVKPGASE
jgi:MFS family permease